jgi:hypothetical protein
VIAVRCVDQLGVDANPPGSVPDASLQQIAHAEFLGDLAHVSRLALVGEGRIAGDDE